MFGMDAALETMCADYESFLRRDAIAMGYTDRSLRALVATGELVKVRHGAYTTAVRWAAEDALGRHRIVSKAAYRTANCEALLSHTSSLSIHRGACWELPLDLVQLTRRDKHAGRHVSGVQQHRGVVLDSDIEWDGCVPYMAATRTALELTTVVDVPHSLVVVNDLLHRRKTSMSQLLNRYVDMELWPRTLRTDLVLRLARTELESIGETRYDWLFFQMGLPRAIPQFEVRNERGILIAELDFAWPDLGVFIEFDGKVKYLELLRPGESATDRVLREKQRDREVTRLTGMIGDRFTWQDLYNEARTRQRIRALFETAARGRRVIPAS